METKNEIIYQRNEILYQKAVDAATELFNDQSVSQAEAANNLRALISEIEIMLSTLEG